MGFEIDRDETRTVLFVHMGMAKEAADSAKTVLNFDGPPAQSPIGEKFLSDCRRRFGLLAKPQS